jgi:hypothetical protein
MSELGPTVDYGIVSFRDRKRSMTIEEVESALDMLRFFEFYAKISYMPEKCPIAVLSVCPVCNGLDPQDPNSVRPELRKAYNENSGHKPGCKLDEIIRSLSSKAPILDNAINSLTRGAINDKDLGTLQG